MSTAPLDPGAVVCTNCNARPGESCTQPTDTGRVKVAWFHLAREGAAKEPRR